MSAQWQTALQVWDDFGEQRVVEDAMIFTSTISACERGREWAIGQRTYIKYDHFRFTSPKLLHLDTLMLKINLFFKYFFFAPMTSKSVEPTNLY